MKKIVIAAALLSAVAYSYGQGTVGLGNSGFLISYKSSDSASAVAMPVQTSGNAFTFALYAAPVGTAAPRSDNFGNTLADLNAPGGYEQYISPGGTGIATTYGNNSPSGSGVGRVLFGGSAQNALFSSFTPGTSVNLILIGFKTTGVGTIANANSTEAGGASPIATILLGGGAFPNGSLFGAAPNQISGFTIVPVPEPASFALAGLGAAALLIFRRRN